VAGACDDDRMREQEGGGWLPPQAPGAGPAPRFEPGAAPQPPAPPDRPGLYGGGFAPPAGADPSVASPAAPRPAAPVRTAGAVNPKATTALILGIAGLATFLFLGLGLLFPVNMSCSVLAWVYGRQAMRSVERGEIAVGRANAQAGMTLGIIGTILGAVALVVWIVLFSIYDDPLEELGLEESLIHVVHGFGS
jgi:hypothetical protein